MKNQPENNKEGHGILMPTLFVGGAIVLLVLLKLMI